MNRIFNALEYIRDGLSECHYVSLFQLFLFAVGFIALGFAVPMYWIFRISRICLS